MSGQSQSPKEPGGFLKGEIRIDQAHVIKASGSPHTLDHGNAPLVGTAVEAAPRDVSIGVEQSLEQLREHAAQLADRLQAEQGDLDRRQSTLVAQEANLEAKWQNARQWFAERQQELEQRSESIAQRELEMTEREAAAEVRAAELTQVREETLAEREHRLQLRVEELEEREAELQGRFEALDQDRTAWDERNERVQAREA